MSDKECTLPVLLNFQPLLAVCKCYFLENFCFCIIATAPWCFRHFFELNYMLFVHLALHHYLLEKFTTIFHTYSYNSHLFWLPLPGCFKKLFSLQLHACTLPKFLDIQISICNKFLALNLFKKCFWPLSYLIELFLAVSKTCLTLYLST